MAKILNLDEFKSEKTIVLAGQPYSVRAMTVGEFMAAAEFDEQLKAATPDKQLDLLADLLIRHIPALNREQLLNLELGQLMVLMNYVRGQEVPAAPNEAPTEGNAENPKSS